MHTFTSLKLRISVANVELTTDGLFLTLGNIMPPLRDANLDVVFDVLLTFGGSVLY